MVLSNSITSQAISYASQHPNPKIFRMNWNVKYVRDAKQIHAKCDIYTKAQTQEKNVKRRMTQKPHICDKMNFL